MQPCVADSAGMVLTPTFVFIVEIVGFTGVICVILFLRLSSLLDSALGWTAVTLRHFSVGSPQSLPPCPSRVVFRGVPGILANRSLE